MGPQDRDPWSSKSDQRGGDRGVATLVCDRVGIDGWVHYSSVMSAYTRCCDRCHQVKDVPTMFPTESSLICRRCLAIERRGPERKAAKMRLIQVLVDIDMEDPLDGKVCTKCKEWKVSSDFHKWKDGLQYWCRSCNASARAKKREQMIQAGHVFRKTGRPKQTPPPAPPSKICSKCKEMIDISQFYQKKDGFFASWCRSCMNVLAKERITKVRLGEATVRHQFHLTQDRACVKCQTWKQATDFRDGRTSCKTCDRAVLDNYFQTVNGGLARLLAGWKCNHPDSLTPLTQGGLERAYERTDGHSLRFPSKRVSFEHGAPWKATAVRPDVSADWSDDNVAICCQEFLIAKGASPWTNTKVEELKHRIGRRLDDAELEDLLKSPYLKVLYNSMKQSAKKRHHVFNITFEEMIDIIREQRGLCAVSTIPMEMNGQAMSWRISPEQIVPSKGYTKDNLCFIALEFNVSCNRLSEESKEGGEQSQWTREKFLEWTTALGWYDKEEQKEADM